MCGARVNHSNGLCAPTDNAAIWSPFSVRSELCFARWPWIGCWQAARSASYLERLFTNPRGRTWKDQRSVRCVISRALLVIYGLYLHEKHDRDEVAFYVYRSANAASIFMFALWNRTGHYIFAVFSSFLLSSSFCPRLLSAVANWCLTYFYTWCGPSANLECRSEICCTRLAENTGRKKSPKIAIFAPSHKFVGLYLRN